MSKQYIKMKYIDYKKLQGADMRGLDVAIFLQPHEREKLGMRFSWVFCDMDYFDESQVKFIHSK